MARSLGELTDLLDDLKKAGDGLDAEPSKRWRANYEYILARLELQIGWLNEYQFALGELRREEQPALDPSTHNGWRLTAADRMRSDPASRRLLAATQKRLQRIVREHPGTPWEWYAKRDQAAPEGLIWKPVKVGE